MTMIEEDLAREMRWFAVRDRLQCRHEGVTVEGDGRWKAVHLMHLPQNLPFPLFFPLFAGRCPADGGRGSRVRGVDRRVKSLGACHLVCGVGVGTRGGAHRLAPTVPAFFHHIAGPPIQWSVLSLSSG